MKLDYKHLCNCIIINHIGMRNINQGLPVPPLGLQGFPPLQ